MRTLTALLVSAALAAAFAGCQSDVRVRIKAPVASAIDLQRLHSFAVMPFSDERGKLPKPVLESLAETARQRLERAAGTRVLSQADTRAALRGDPPQPDAWSDPDNVREWGEMLNVDALIVGQISYDAALDVQHIPVDRYSYTQQRIVTEVETRIVRSHYLNLDIAVLDAESGEELFNRAYTEKYREPHSALSFAAAEAFHSSDAAAQLGRRAVQRFARAVTPHYELQERTLAR